MEKGGGMVLWSKEGGIMRVPSELIEVELQLSSGDEIQA